MMMMMMLTSLAPLASIQTIGEIKYIFKVIEGARKAPPDLQRDLYLSNDFGTK